MERVTDKKNTIKWKNFLIMSSWKGAILKGFQTLLQQNHQKVFNSNKFLQNWPKNSSAMRIRGIDKWMSIIHLSINPEEKARGGLSHAVHFRELKPWGKQFHVWNWKYFTKYYSNLNMLQRWSKTRNIYVHWPNFFWLIEWISAGN